MTNFYDHVPDDSKPSDEEELVENRAMEILMRYPDGTTVPTIGHYLSLEIDVVKHALRSMLRTDSIETVAVKRSSDMFGLREYPGFRLADDLRAYVEPEVVELEARIDAEADERDFLL